MRIVIDMQGAQTESRYRGIGRYTFEFARAVIRNRGEHEILLVLSGLFPETIEPLFKAFEDVLPKENILIWHALGPVKSNEPNNESNRIIAEAIREAFISNLQPDIVHIVSLFEGFVDNAVVSVGSFDQSTPISITLHDLIPLLNPQQYLVPNPAYEDYYLRKISYFKHVACFLSNSEFTRQEALSCLDIDPEKIINVSTAVGSNFQLININEENKDKLIKKFSLSKPFILYTGGADERKNLSRLLEAWSLLPKELRINYQLVFAGRMPEGEILRLKLFAEQNKLDADELLFTGYVSDEELIQFYSLCVLFVFPSWHEGFGLPALEAMACGAPVLGSNTASLPEVIGYEEALFDPFNSQQISEKIKAALINPEFKERLRQHGLEQAKKFSWDETAKVAINTWERICSENKKNKDESLKTWEYTKHSLEKNYKELINILIKHISKRNESELIQLSSVLAKNEKEIEDFLRLKKLPKKIQWRLEGPFDSSYSLALVNREIARALTQLGHEVILHSTEGPGDFLPNKDFLLENKDLNEMYQKEALYPQKTVDITSRNLYPPRVEDMESRFNFLHGYAWEESGFPQKWVEDFNDYLQGILVTSEHVKKVMIDNGVAIPVQVTGNGVDHWQNIKADENISLNAKSFRYLHVSSCFPRKGVDALLKAYGNAFSSSDDVTLIIKTIPNPHNEVYKWLDEAKKGRADYPDVLIINTEYTESQLKGLYEQCHVLVAPSRAEGFGLPLAEAMLSDLAVITTGWSGQLDFCTKETSWLVDYSFERAQSHFHLFNSVWAEPNLDDLAKVMREVFECSENERKLRIEKGKKLLLGNLRWENVVNKMVTAANSWSISNKKQEPKIGWISTWNTRCGIATYSEHLIQNLPGQVTILAPSIQEKVEEGEQVIRCWNIGEEDTLAKLKEKINSENIDTLVIQFNYGFFNLDLFSDFLIEQTNKGLIIIVMMHSTVDPIHAPHKKLSILIPALSCCHRILVHSPNDMNRLKSYGLINNVALFPHGILDFEDSEFSVKAKEKEFLITSYGFFLPHKGLLELIEAISILRNQNVSVKLNMLNAEYPAPESRLMIDKAKKLISDLKLNDAITLCADFLDDYESLNKLSQSDLILFPYQNTGESASGAVRYGLSAGIPVAVTPLSIFEDVDSVVFKLPGQSSQHIAEGIVEIREKLLLQDSLAVEIMETAKNWRAQHRYSIIGKMLFNLIRSIQINGKY